MAFGLQPESHRIEGETYNIGMRLWTVAEQNHEARQYPQGQHPKAEIAPSLEAPEEEHAQQTQHDNLDQSVVGQQQGFQSYGKKNADLVGVAMMGGYHFKHLLIEHKDIVKSGIDSRQQ